MLVMFVFTVIVSVAVGVQYGPIAGLVVCLLIGLVGIGHSVKAGG